MSDFKEFQGKNLDEAIESACDYYNLKRDRLEIEILGGGSSGIFGIMGVKKAKVKARPRVQVNATGILKEEKETPKAPVAEAKKPAPKVEAKAPKLSHNRLPDPINEEDDVNGNVIEEFDSINGNVIHAPKAQRKQPRDRKPRPEKAREERPRRERQPRERQPREERPREVQREDKQDERPRANMADFDPVVLETTVRDVMTELLKPIIGDTTLIISLETDRVKVFIDDEENSGLIIGREGQTLSSIQYLVNRLISRKMEASVRIQVDTGDYRERQDDKLRQVAWHLAEKAGSMGRTQSTKPLSSYHRRVVHLALQENEDVFTRSKGDGPMKRVLIVPKSRKSGTGTRPPRP